MHLIKRENKMNSFFPLFTVITCGLHFFTFLLLMFHGMLLQQLNKKLTPQSLVQLADGRAITVDPQPNLERNPEAIRRFVGEAMILIVNSSGQQQPIIFWDISSQLLAETFRQRFRSEILNIKPNQPEIFNRNAEDILVIKKISQPIKIDDGSWKVEFIADKLTVNKFDMLGESSKLHKEIYVRTIDKEPISLPPAPLQQYLAAYRLSEARLEIYNICDIQDKKCIENRQKFENKN